jgi:hydroxysqualene synthase
MSPTTQASELASGKGDKDENFPVASRLIAAPYREPILVFYRFARTADDVADNQSASPDQKLALLEDMRATLAGERDSNPEALALRAVQEARGITAQHGLDLLEAFRRDVTKLRYRDWADLMDYCRYSAAPVGRFVLDVHGEGQGAWPANDALCSALQVINHLQDCGKDYRQLDRVYVPQDHLAAAGIGVETLGEPKASPALRSVIVDLAGRTEVLLRQSASFAAQIHEGRLRLNVAVIQRLAEDLNRRLRLRDPLSERVHHSKPEAAGLALMAAIALPFRRRAA